MHPRNNCFDLLRHFAAFLVLFSHNFPLSGRSEPIFLHWDTFGFIAVAIFFSISGYFMPGSFSSSQHFLIYMEKRCRRIFPGLIVCVFIMVYVIGVSFSPEPWFQYVTNLSILKTDILYTFLHGRPIPGVFSDFIYKEALNGSLWTLPVEFMSYIILGIALSYNNSWKSVLTLLLMAIFFQWMISAHRIEDIAYYGVPMSYLSLFGIAFTSAALMSMLKPCWFPVRYHLLIIAVMFIALLEGTGDLSILGTLSLALITVVIGVSFQDRLLKGRFDISYGIYIYAFPTQQLVINLITQKFLPSLIISACFTILLGFISYQYIEKPFLYHFAQKRKAKRLQTANVYDEPRVPA